MIFMSGEHKCFYEDCINKAGSQNDSYHKALFYTLGLTEETRHNIDRLYDFEGQCIRLDGLFEDWHTRTTLNVTRMAFNLYNGFAGNTGCTMLDFTPERLFCTDLMVYFFEAVKLRHPRYFNEAATAAQSDKEKEWIKAGNEDRLIVLPAPIGTPVYAPYVRKRTIHGKTLAGVDELHLSGYVKQGSREFYATYDDSAIIFDIKHLNLFLTRKEAEETLWEMLKEN